MFLIEDIHSPINLFPLYSAILVPTSVIPSLYPQCLNRQLTISRVHETSLCSRPPRCVFTGPVVVRLAEMANERERERNIITGRNALCTDPKSAALPACRHRRERRAPKMPRPTTSAT